MILYVEINLCQQVIAYEKTHYINGLRDRIEVKSNVLFQNPNRLIVTITRAITINVTNAL